MKKQKLTLVAIVLVALVSFSSGWSLSKYYSQKQAPALIKNIADDTAANEASIAISDMDEVWAKLKSSYYDASKLDISKLQFGAVKGFVKGVGDPYTVFLDPEESKEFENSLEGELEGIGAELEVKQGKLIVVTPIKNSPAAKAGIKPGDIIYKIDDKLAEEMTVYNAIKAIRGKKGTVVTLIIVRENEPEPLEIKITRAEIVIDSVTVKKLGNDIFHIAINQFNDHTVREFDNAIRSILLDKAKGIILDVRGNGGGYLETSVDVLSELLAGQKPAVIIKKRDQSQNQTVNTNGNARIADIPLVVLIDKGSASASEIVAGAVQDYKRGILIGETTFGKGSVQELISLNDSSTLRLTIAKWFTPLNRSIDETGITPDKEIKLTEEDAKADRDPQLEAAINYLVSPRT